jgi:hypothetical protein
MAVTKSVLAVLAMLMISLPVAAGDVADRIIGNWAGSFKHRDIDRLQFSKSSFNMEIDGCEISGSYKIDSQDQLLLTPHAVDRARQSSPTFCNTQYPEFIKDKEANLGPVEFISADRMLVNAGRLRLARRP